MTMSLKVSARALLRVTSPCRTALAMALLTLAAAVCDSPSEAVASEIVVKNDSMPPTGEPLPSTFDVFRFGAWLDAPTDGSIVGVQILWGSKSGGGASSEQIAIRISSFDTELLLPGSPWATINSPVLIDGALNEFRYLDPASNLQPIYLPVHAGDSFFVDLELKPVMAGPSILMDADGESSPYRNMYQTGNIPWIPLFAAGIPNFGDLGIRVIIQPVPEPPTCILGVSALAGMLAFRRRSGRTKRAEAINLCSDLTTVFVA